MLQKSFDNLLETRTHTHMHAHCEPFRKAGLSMLQEHSRQYLFEAYSLCPTVWMEPWGWDKQTHTRIYKMETTCNCVPVHFCTYVCVCMSQRAFICKGGQIVAFLVKCFAPNSGGLWPPLYVWRNDWTNGGWRINESACSSFPWRLVCLLRMEHQSQRRGGC